MVSAAFKNRTRDEIIAAVRESIRKKHEWQERAGGCVKMLFQEKKNSNRFNFGCIYPTNRTFTTMKIEEFFTLTNEPLF